MLKIPGGFVTEMFILATFKNGLYSSTVICA
jgi:hypothetical protein